MTIIPSIDLRNGKVVRLRQGDYAAQLNYDVDPVATASSFAQQGATHLHIVDLDGAKQGQPVQFELVGRIIASTKLQTQAGGGIRTEDDIRKLFNAGANSVVIGTRAVNDLPWLQELLTGPEFRQRIILALDARDGFVATHGWMSTSKQRAVDLAEIVNHWPLAGILYTDVAKDGMMQGPNYDATRQLVEATSIPVIASGGVGSIEHIRKVRETGCAAVVVGRSLYEGAFTLKQALAAAAG